MPSTGIDAKTRLIATNKLKNAFAEKSEEKRMAPYSVKEYQTIRDLFDIYIKALGLVIKEKDELNREPGLGLNLMLNSAKKQKKKKKKKAAEEEEEEESEEETTQPKPKGLMRHCRDTKCRPVELIVDSIDCSKLPADFDQASNTQEFYILDDEVDEMIADDLVTNTPRGGDYSVFASVEHRTNKIMRRLGQEYFIGLKSYKNQVFRELLSVKWKKEMSIVEFNNCYENAVGKCANVGLMKTVTDQIELYLCLVSMAERTR